MKLKILAAIITGIFIASIASIANAENRCNWHDTYSDDCQTVANRSIKIPGNGRARSTARENWGPDYNLWEKAPDVCLYTVCLNSIETEDYTAGIITRYQNEMSLDQVKERQIALMLSKRNSLTQTPFQVTATTQDYGDLIFVIYEDTLPDVVHGNETVIIPFLNDSSEDRRRDFSIQDVTSVNNKIRQNAKDYDGIYQGKRRDIKQCNNAADVIAITW